jgi:hypothetical protein
VQGTRQPYSERYGENLSDENGTSQVQIRRRKFANGKRDPREMQKLSVESREARILENLNRARESLTTSAPKAAERLVDLVDADRDDIALRAAGDVLDRVGIGRSQTVDVNVDAGERLIGLMEELDRRERQAHAVPTPALGSEATQDRARVP